MGGLSRVLNTLIHSRVIAANRLAFTQNITFSNMYSCKPSTRNHFQLNIITPLTEKRYPPW